MTGVCLESFPRKVRLAKVSLEIFPQTLPSLPLVYHEHLQFLFPSTRAAGGIILTFYLKFFLQTRPGYIALADLGCWSRRPVCLYHTAFPSSLEQADLLLKIASECLFVFKIPSFGVICF